MKTLTLLLVITSLLSAQLEAQDIITLKNNSTIEAKNIIVSNKEVKYQNYFDNSGEILLIQRENIVSILYENGSKLKMYEAKKTFNNSNSGNNLITFHFLDFAINSFTFSYERIIAKGRYGIQIPFSFGYSEKTANIPLPPPFDSDYNVNPANQFYTGVTFNIYPTGQGKVKYFLGPSLRFGNGLFHEEYNSYGQHNPPPIKTGYIKFLINNGIVATFASSLSVAVIGSIGIQHMYKPGLNPTSTTGALSLNLSFRF